MIYDLKDFNRRLSVLMKKRRKEMKITQKELAERTKIDLKYLQKIESEKIIIEPRLRTLSCLAQHLEMSFKDFMLQLFGDDEHESTR